MCVKKEQSEASKTTIYSDLLIPLARRQYVPQHFEISIDN